ncbi:hypothetical protein PoB_004426400 [Plakobranchus ocellatus]|uniref:Uncharacterized protein n=1 Tax=Plakobranchus ocellatus TaxID=259542 RepID=A0AAV4BHD8_9GAST|nr:hypothetical protein PoB_004426400 [Plakobranchus ocellatus]
MAARGRATPTRKEEILALLKEDFFKNVNRYLSAVTAAIRDEPPTQADEIFHSAVAFLSQEMPNPISQTITPPQLIQASSTFTPVVVTQTSSAFNRVQPIENLSIQSSARSTPITPVQSIESLSIQNSARSTPISPLISRPLEEVRQTTTFVPTLTAVAESANVTTQAAAAAAAAAAVTPPPTAPSASALSRPLKDVRQRNTFDAKIRADQSTLYIRDVQLLPGGRLLLADYNNECVKLFDTQGQHLHTLECRSEPYRLAVLDSSSIRHTVAVTLPRCSGIDILEVTGDNMEVEGASVALWIESQPLDLQGLFCCGFEPCVSRPSLTESPKA